MDLIRLTKAGEIKSKDMVVMKDSLPYLSHQVILEEGFLLRSYFEMLLKYPDLIKLNAFFPQYIGEYRISPERYCVTDDFDELVLSKTIEMIGYPGDPRLEIYQTLKGRRKSEIFDLKFILLQNLLDMPLILGKLKHVVFGDVMDVFEFDTVFSFFEFLDGIIWELSFNGAFTACEIRRS